MVSSTLGNRNKQKQNKNLMVVYASSLLRFLSDSVPNSSLITTTETDHAHLPFKSFVFCLLFVDVASSFVRRIYTYTMWQRCAHLRFCVPFVDLCDGAHLTFHVPVSVGVASSFLTTRKQNRYTISVTLTMFTLPFRVLFALAGGTADMMTVTPRNPSQ